MKITRLRLRTPNLPAQKEFYSTLLELPARQAGDILHIQAGQSGLIFTPAPQDWAGAYHFCFNIPKDSFSAAKEWISARLPLLKDDNGNDEFHSNTWNADSLYFKDPAGNILEFIARHDIATTLNSPFSGRAILSVSEIGLPSKNVIAFAEELCRKLSLSAYKQGFNETFTPLGDEHGLLILPVENRIWYPNTGVPAKLLEVQVDLEANGNAFQIRGVPYEIRP